MEIGRQKGGALARGGSGNRRGGSTAEAMRIWLISNSQTRRNRYISRRLLSIGDYPGDIARIERRSFLALSQCEREHLLLRHRVRFMYQYIYIIYILYICVRGDADREREREREYPGCSSSPPRLRTIAEIISLSLSLPLFHLTVA